MVIILPLNPRKVEWGRLERIHLPIPLKLLAIAWLTPLMPTGLLCTRNPLAVARVNGTTTYVNKQVKTKLRTKNLVKTKMTWA